MGQAVGMKVGKTIGLARKSSAIENLNAIEDRMGRLASLLTEVAEALAEHPDGLKVLGARGLTLQPETRPDAIKVEASEWPSITEVEDILGAWYAARRELRSVAA